MTPLDFFETLARLLRLHPRLALATVVSAAGSIPRETGARMLVLPDGTSVDTLGGGRFESLVIADALDLLRGGGRPFTRRYSFAPSGKDSFGAVCGGQATVLIEVLEAAPRLLVVGAGHCGRALARLAHLTGYRVRVADERPAQLDPSAFPEGVALVRVLEDYSDLPAPSADEAVALVSRGHATDGLALRRLRGAAVAYLGMMGSEAKKKVLFEELRAEGWSQDELSRIHSPIGLPIGAETPEEIAVSILAEIVASRRLPRGRAVDAA